MSTAPDAQGRDWTAMHRADFDPTAPLALVDHRSVSRRLEAVTHSNGTEALFGEAPKAGRTPRPSRPAATDPDTETLF
ncbi:hypothetical protein [Streptomyces similanensis]|uniref:Uncharacterized protein n=1 Tax=Streptomyces similanensis TaxID=1274988 RepID=A0ABP9L7G1_9ACTN